MVFSSICLVDKSLSRLNCGSFKSQIEASFLLWIPGVKENKSQSPIGGGKLMFPFRTCKTMFFLFHYKKRRESC
ncbi:hypothetical protein LINPERHAP2_LOCUS13871 [Linum perenne]